MYKRLYLIILIFIASTGLILFFFRKGKEKKIEINKSVRLRKLNEPELQIVNSIELKNAAHRLLPSGDSVFICVDTSVLTVSVDFKRINKFNLPKELNSQILYVSKNNTRTAGFSFGNSSFFWTDKDSIISEKVTNGYVVNSVLIDNTFFCDRLYLGKNTNYKIEEFDIRSKKWKDKLDLREFLKAEIAHCDDCFESTLEGNFFKVDDNSFGYYFYRGGYFIIFKNGKYILKKTLIDRPFLEYKRVEADFNGMKARVCQTESDFYVQHSACAFGDKIFILSNIVDEKKIRTIDVYSFGDLSYQYSFYLPEFEGQLPEIILFTKKDNLIVSYDKGAVVSYSLSIR